MWFWLLVVTGKKDLVCGGKLIIVCGDLRQTLPVIPKSNEALTIESSIIFHPSWRRIIAIELVRNMRVELAGIDGNEDLASKLDAWRKYLLTIGNGDETGLVALPDELIYRDAITNAPVVDADTLIDKVFGNMGLASNTKPSALEGKGILTINNVDVDDVNEKALDKFRGEAVEFLSVDRAEDPMQWPEELLHQQRPNGMPQHRIRLKEGCPIMLLRNLNLTKGLVNGARFTVTRIGNYYLTCKFLGNEERREEVVHIPRIHLRSKDGKEGFAFCRRQFPIRLAFCMTVNKVNRTRQHDKHKWRKRAFAYKSYSY